MAQGGQARLREALQAGGPGSQKEKGPPIADGILTVTPDTPEAVEWRTRRSIIDSAGASSSYLEDESGEARPCRLLRPGKPQKKLVLMGCLCAGPKPAELYGKFTWKIENFSEISKRELRSTVFEVGSYKWCAPARQRMAPRAALPALLRLSARVSISQLSASTTLSQLCLLAAAASAACSPWQRRVCFPSPRITSLTAVLPPRYILVYPQGCDVCNHLSLFLCVADYDKLLPGTLLVLDYAQPQCLRVSRAGADVPRLHRLEPLCAIHHCCCEQGPQEV